MDYKHLAASRALEEVTDGMVLGLGTGSTTSIFINLLGEKMQAGSLRNLVAVPTSSKTAAQAKLMGIPLVSLADYPSLDVAVDGADEVDPQLNMIKGLGRALLREKLVEIHAKRLLIIADETKLVPRLGTRGPLPVEVVPFEAQATMHWLSTLGCRAELWYEPDGSIVVTDNGNYLVSCWFDGGILDPKSLARLLADRPGVVEHGLFLDMANRVIVAGNNGIQIMDRS